MKRVVRFSMLIFLAACLAIGLSSLSAEAKEKKIPEDIKMTQTGDKTPVIFSHVSHLKDGEVKCKVCHTKVFKMKLGKTAAKMGQITSAAMKEGKFCGTCHNGKDSFDVAAEENCAKCHP